jgi:hypothetical protein
MFGKYTYHTNIFSYEFGVLFICLKRYLIKHVFHHIYILLILGERQLEVCNMGTFFHVVLFILLVVGIRCEEHLHANGPLGKVHLTAEAPNPRYCTQRANIFSRFMRPVSVKLNELKVSSTNYSNAETIYVTWTPSPTPCKADFIGVYFVETPVETGNK